MKPIEVHYKRNRRILITFIVFLFSLVTFVTSTYAWFTLATRVTAGDLQMNIISGIRLEMSLDGANYFGSISSELIEKTIGDCVVFRECTTTDGINFKSNYRNVKFYENYRAPIPEIDYVTFPLWFRTDDARYKHMFLVNNLNNSYNYEVAKNQPLDGTFFFSKGVEYPSEVTYQYSPEKIIQEGEKYTYFAQDAMRIGIRELPATSKYLLKEDTRESSKLRSMIYDPSEDETRGFGKSYGAFDYLLKVKNIDIPLPSIIPDTKYRLTSFNKANPYYANDEESLICTFQPGMKDGKPMYYARVQITIWLEGWDADAIDPILYDELLIQLKFRGATVGNPYKQI